LPTYSGGAHNDALKQDVFFVIAQIKNRTDFPQDESTVEGDPRWEAAIRASRSSALARATHLRAILLFVVRQAILEPEKPVPEFDIAYHVLGRRSDFNPLDDNIVRVQMGHLRKKLEQYFSSEGENEEVLIAIPLGSYKPVFSSRFETASALRPIAEPLAVPRETPESADTGRSVASGSEVRYAAAKVAQASHERVWMLVGLIAAGMVILSLAAAYISLLNRDRALHESLYAWQYKPTVAAFWSSFLDARPVTDVVMADSSFSLVQLISKKSFSFQDYYSRGYINQLNSPESSPEMRAALNLIAAKNLVNWGDFRVAQRILTLDPLGKSIHLYYAREYMPSLLKQDNVILIGSQIANPWDELFEGHMNFAAVSGGNTPTYILNRAPAAGEQSTYNPSGSVGYCTVAYLPNSEHNSSVLLLEGTGSEATEAAEEFLLSEEQLSNFQKMLHVTKLPNFEVLLKASQVKGTPLSTTLVAYRIYPDQQSLLPAKPNKR
jgi:hypothetical protein